MTDAQLARIEALVNEGPLPYTEAALLVECGTAWGDSWPATASNGDAGK